MERRERGMGKKKKKTGDEISTTQVNALDRPSIYAFIAYWGDQPTYESYYQLLSRVGLVDERR